MCSPGPPPLAPLAAIMPITTPARCRFPAHFAPVLVIRHGPPNRAPDGRRPAGGRTLARAGGRTHAKSARRVPQPHRPTKSAGLPLPPLLISRHAPDDPNQDRRHARAEHIDARAHRRTVRGRRRHLPLQLQPRHPRRPRRPLRRRARPRRDAPAAGRHHRRPAGAEAARRDRFADGRVQLDEENGIPARSRRCPRATSAG